VSDFIFKFLAMVLYGSAVLMTILMTILMMTGAVSAAGPVSHQAVYDIELYSVTTATDIKTISGQTYFLFEDVCDGWSVIEDSAVSFGFGEEGMSDFISHYETWESKDGSSFSFSALENSNIAGERFYEGFANSGDDSAEAFHSIHDGTSTEIPANTVFPTKHMILSLKKARDGAVLHQSSVFVAGEVDDSLYLVNTVLGKKKHDPAPETLGSIGQSGYWPITIAYFKPNAIKVEPEYEVSFKVQDNGVIRSYIVDYRNFSMRAELSSGQSVAGRPC
jgi:hypothetical protein